MYEAVIKGVTPILMHKYVVGSISGANDEGGKEINPIGGVDYSEEWIKSAYTSMQEMELDVMDRTIVLPDYVLTACLREAGAKVKVKGTRTAKSAMVSGILLSDMEYPILYNGGSKITLSDIKKNDWLHMAGVKIQSRRVDRIRPFVPVPWKVKIKFDISHPELKPKLVEQVFSIAGVMCGVGDWRPNSPKPGSFGRFELESFKKVVE